MHKPRAKNSALNEVVNIAKAIAAPAPKLIQPKPAPIRQSLPPISSKSSSITSAKPMSSPKETSNSTSTQLQKPNPAQTSKAPPQQQKQGTGDATMTPEQSKQRDYQRGFSLWVSQHEEMKNLVKSLTESFKEDGNDEDYTSFRAKEQELQKSLYQQWIKLPEDQRRKSSIIACRLLGARSVLETKSTTAISKPTTSTTPRPVSSPTPKKDEPVLSNITPSQKPSIPESNGNHNQTNTQSNITSKPISSTNKDDNDEEIEVVSEIIEEVS